MELQELINVLLKRKLYFLIIPLITAALAFFSRFSSDRSYLAESQISTGITLANDLLGESKRLSPFEISLSFGNMKENMSSKLVVNRLSYKILYRDLSSDRPFRTPTFSEGGISAPKGDTLNLVLDALNGAINNFQLINHTDQLGEYIHDLLDKYRYNETSLLDHAKVFRIGNTDFINILFTSEVPKLSAYVSNLWADSFVEYYNYQKLNHLNESLDVLTDILKEKQTLLDQSTDKLNQYKTRYNYHSAEIENDPVGEYEKLIRDKESYLGSLNIRLQDIREKIANSDNTSSFVTRQRIIRLKKEIDRLSTRQLTNPDNRQLADSIETLRDNLQSEIYRHTSSSSDKNNLDNLFQQENELKINYQIALSDLQKLKSQYRVERGLIQNLAANKSVLENLETEVLQAREEFIDAQDKYNQARSELISGGSTIKLSYYGDIPEDPQSRKTAIFTIAGLMGGTIITLFVVLAVEFLDQRLKNIFKFKRAVKTLPSGLIQNFDNSDNNLMSILEGEHLANNSTSGNPFLQTLKIFRYKILSTDPCQTLLFTSLKAQAGKSFLLTSIAYTLSLLNKKVLIFDTNFRNPELSQLAFENEKAKTALDELINGDEERLEKLDFISHTENPNVHIIPAIPLDKTPEEVFAKVQLQKVLDRLKEAYDIILMEGAEINGFSDSRELLRLSDQSIVIYSAWDDFDSKDKNSQEFLQSNDSKILLTILNKVDQYDVPK